MLDRKSMNKFILPLVVFIGVSSSANGSKQIEILKGRYAFNWANAQSNKKCLKIDNKMLAEFSRNYLCDLKGNIPTADGIIPLSCKKNDKTKNYLIFITSEACEHELETQKANGD